MVACLRVHPRRRDAEERGNLLSGQKSVLWLRRRVRIRLGHVRVTDHEPREPATQFQNAASQRSTTAEKRRQTRCTPSEPLSACCQKFLAGLAGSWSVTHVVTAASIPADRASGYAQYLESKTVEHEHGAYYLTPDGEMTEPSGRWHADPETLARLGVTTGQVVDGGDFLALMEGRHPGTGEWVRREGAGGGRGGGIDVTFSAPKSVSVVWALTDRWQREGIEQAHTRAVERSMRYLREQVPVVRRRYSGQVVEEQARDVIAAEYRHTTARGVTASQAPDPQLHSHVVITGAIREDDRIVAVASRPVFRAARELGAFYRSALADELATQGYGIEQNTGKDGKYFEIQGVPRELCEAFSGRSREVARAAERFRARYGRAPERGELRNLALENRATKTPITRPDLERAWQDTGYEHAFDADHAVRLIAFNEPHQHDQTVEDRIEARLTEHKAIFDAKELRTVALEQTAGEMPPDQALMVAKEMICDRRILTLESGQMTTLAIRAQEQAIERRTTQLAQPAGRDVSQLVRENAARDIAERIAAPLSPEQQHALAVLTGPERIAVLVGPAGTGKGVVIDAAARAEQMAARETIGVAGSWSTAARLATDSPALHEQTMALDALLARAKSGTVHVGADTTIILDEAGMADHTRMAALAELVEHSGAKLIAVGDGKQLPSIGPGGMFDRIANHTPTAELQTIHRTKDPAEQHAWRALRNGEPERALAHYASREALHVADTRDQAAENAVQAWAKLTREHPIRDIALIADASNTEIDRLNARAQHLRLQHGELGRHETPLPHVHYGIHRGDLIAFTHQHRPPRAARVENGTRGEITALHPDGSATIALDGSDRHVTLAPDDLRSIRLAYAQHVYRQQGATVERAVILTGGWQTSKETAYVEATRARQRTDWHIARQDLGLQGQDPDPITHVAQRMSQSRAHTPTTTQQALPDPAWDPTHNPLHLRDSSSRTPWPTSKPDRDNVDRGSERSR
jgi:conjugative relaxase-like TrwC/TraI family protein